MITSSQFTFNALTVNVPDALDFQPAVPCSLKIDIDHNGKPTAISVESADIAELIKQLQEWAIPAPELA
jgi:hypothetical protein